MVDLERYPLLDPSQPRYRELVRNHQQELEMKGVTTLPGLVTRLAIDTAVKVVRILLWESLTVLLKEVESKAEESYTMQTDHNIYLTGEDWDRSQGAGHVCNRRLDTKVAALACDLLAEEGPLKVLFKSDSFLSFIQQILKVPRLHRNIDPVGAVFVNIYKVGEIYIKSALAE